MAARSRRRSGPARSSGGQAGHTSDRMSARPISGRSRSSPSNEADQRSCRVFMGEQYGVCTGFGSIGSVLVRSGSYRLSRHLPPRPILVAWRHSRGVPGGRFSRAAITRDRLANAPRSRDRVRGSCAPPRGRWSSALYEQRRESGMPARQRRRHRKDGADRRQPRTMAPVYYGARFRPSRNRLPESRYGAGTTAGISFERALSLPPLTAVVV
jgi:hypothetical protein